MHGNCEMGGIVVIKVPNESKEPLNTPAHEMSHAILKHKDMLGWKAEAGFSAYLVLAHYGVD
ncbi:MAG: hypothetical protein JRN37_00010 [Nitrososphaerota archaeon]|nr:hypothetical protein [Nitrososphaerota archaeon]MDG7043394.1 hypothetical protein [Nitrososphaerota archaeon]